MTNFKLADIKNLNQNSTEVDVYLYDEIGYDEETGKGISGQRFAKEMQWLLEYYPSIKKIKVRINCVGGSVIEGYSIFSSIQNINQNKKGVFVDTYIDGIACSMASVIALAGKKVYCNEFALVMIHNPAYTEKNQYEITPKMKEVLEKFTESVITIYKSRLTIEEDKIKEMMDKETWLNAEEAKTLGFVDEIIQTNIKPTVPQPNNSNRYEVYNIYNSFLSKSNHIAMEQTKIPIELASVLGVDNSTDAVKKVTSLSAENLTLKSRAESLENELNAEKEKIKTFEKQIEEQKKQTIDDFIENSIKEGRIQVAMKEKFIKLANADFETTKGIILGMSKPPKLSTIVNGGTQTQSTSKTETEEDRSSWDYMTWAKKDSKGLEAMKKDQPEVFNILVETYKNKK